jgi:hypothetical protein
VPLELVKEDAPLFDDVRKVEVSLMGGYEKNYLKYKQKYLQLKN